MMKLRNKKGFTLMEMLIVVAIIAILVAIAIPTFSGALNQATIAKNEANVRAAYAETLVKLMTEGMTEEALSDKQEIVEKAKLDAEAAEELIWIYASGTLTVEYHSVQIVNEDLAQFIITSTT